MESKGFRQGSVITAAIGLLVWLGAGLAGAAETHRFANGITVNIYTPQEIAEQWTTLEKDGTYLVHPATSPVELSANTAGMYPFGETLVAEALQNMHGLNTAVEVDVFILPTVPTKTGCSFASRNAIFLAPLAGPADPATVAYITVHEMGHVLTWAFVDGQPDRWKAYLDLRGIDPSSRDMVLEHADRPREILAEDIRVLFGGALATADRGIENRELAPPYQVKGLEEMLAGFFRSKDLPSVQVTSSAFPNPCNPRTTIEMAVPQGMDKAGVAGVLRIFDVRGSLVRTLTGGHLANDRLSIQWDGTGRSGQVVSSGRYFYVIEIGQHVSKGGLTLVR